MKTLKQHIQEAFKLGEDNFKSRNERYTCQPKDIDELHKILKERLKKDKDADLNDIDVSKITDFGRLPNRDDDVGVFYGLDPHNIDISKWDVSNARDMYVMFFGCKNLNCDLSKWDVSKVKNMTYMFMGCQKFEGKGLENWNVSNVISMSCMFKNCKKFNCDLGNWDVSNVKDIFFMFDECENFEGKGLDKWKIPKETKVFNMFYDCPNLKTKPDWFLDQIKNMK